MARSSPLIPLAGLLLCSLVSVLGEPTGGRDKEESRVRAAIERAELSETSLERVEKAIALYRIESLAWDEKWGRLLADYGRKIAALEKQGARRALQQVTGSRDDLASTRPSLTRQPESLRSVVSAEEWERLEPRLLD